MPCCCEFHKGTENQIAPSQTSIVLTIRIEGFETIAVVVTADILCEQVLVMQFKHSVPRQRLTATVRRNVVARGGSCTTVA